MDPRGGPALGNTPISGNSQSVGQHPAYVSGTMERARTARDRRDRQGFVHKGPTKPVCRVGETCTAPAQMTLIVSRAGRTIEAGVDAPVPAAGEKLPSRITF